MPEYPSNTRGAKESKPDARSPDVQPLSAGRYGAEEGACTPPEVLADLFARLRANFVASRELSIPEQRAFLDALQRRLALAPDIAVTPVRVAGLDAEWIAAPGAGERVVLYLHGGGYVIGSLTTHRELASRIARASRARVLLLDYRRAPEHPFPAALEDACAAYRWLLGTGVAPGQIAISGDSAGGGLTLTTLVKLRDDGVPLPACAVTLSAWTDLAVTGDSMRTRAVLDPMVDEVLCRRMAAYYLAGADPHDPLASPLYADLGGLPPLLMQVGSYEVLLDDTTRVAAKARAMGVMVELEVYEGMFHVFQMLAARLVEGQHAIDRLGAFISAHALPADAL